MTSSKNIQVKTRSAPIITLLGLGFIALGTLAFYNALAYYNTSVIFWLCYTSLLIVGIGMVMKKTALIKSQLYILAIPDIIWSLDFLSYLLAGHSLFGIVDYFFLPGPFATKVVTFQHLIAIPAMFFALITLKQKKENSWHISILQLTIFFFLSRLLTTEEVNVNCVYHACGNRLMDAGAIYPVFWFASTFAMVWVSRAVFLYLYKTVHQEEHHRPITQLRPAKN